MTRISPESRTYPIVLPAQFPLTEKRLLKLSGLNRELLLVSNGKNTLIVSETPDFLFGDYENFVLHLPGFQRSMLEDLKRLNEEILFEFEDREEVIVKMGIFALISLLTGAVFASLFAWAKARNSGRVYTEDGGYLLEDHKRKGKFLNRMADVSYISYEKASSEEQDSWNSYIPVSPSLAIEVVSAKKGLKPALKKMKDVWLATRTKLGLVICPFQKKIYVFELGKEKYKEQSIFEDFTHSSLPGYRENFGEFARKI